MHDWTSFEMSHQKNHLIQKFNIRFSVHLISTCLWYRITRYLIFYYRPPQTWANTIAYLTSCFNSHPWPKIANNIDNLSTLSIMRNRNIWGYKIRYLKSHSPFQIFVTKNQIPTFQKHNTIFSWITPWGLINFMAGFLQELNNTLFHESEQTLEQTLV